MVPFFWSLPQTDEALPSCPPAVAPASGARPAASAQPPQGPSPSPLPSCAVAPGSSGAVWNQAVTPSTHPGFCHESRLSCLDAYRMVTKQSKQDIGTFGEWQVVRRCHCPSCKRQNTLRRLPGNFRCADIICDFCGYLAQVKTITSSSVERLPATILGAAWDVQASRMKAGIFFPLFVVLKSGRGSIAIYYLSADLQELSMFRKRRPLSATARKAGWTGFRYHLSAVRQRFVRIV